MNRPENCLVVIFGASGDLTRKKLMPALFDLYRQNLLPERMAILGVSRTEFSDETFRVQIAESIKKHGENQPVESALLSGFSRTLFYQPIDTSNPDDYGKVKARITELADELMIPGNCLFYLSTPPSLYEVIPECLHRHGLHLEDNGRWKRIIIEKPFGRDLKSAQSLNNKIHSCFDEHQVFRIDHYLGKETVQNIMALRFANGIFEPLWNRNYVDHVELTAAEHIGVGGRGGYYEQAGVLRDMVQNHLLQVLGIIAMEPPARFNADAVRNEAAKVFDAIRPLPKERVADFVVRGQYTGSTIKGGPVPGYREERDVAPESRTETFAAVKFFIDHWRWSGVPFYVRSGKRMPTRVTEAVIHFKQAPHPLFLREAGDKPSCNQLVIRIQPDEGILLRFGMKVPGAGFKIQDVPMDFRYSTLADTYIASAYERLLLDSLLGDATLYARSDAVEACWKFISPILEAWDELPEIPIHGYPAGTWGPKEARNLFDNPEMDWRYPCKNLAMDGVYCEL
ncbi:MAG: glucose-6-phosphate dehydrogenase [Planctomycetes bacterium]|nr:glucose-6-phosphate dehydrogenase [Planctomycetota bacterium]